jgi:hypothetical protein
MEGKTLAAAIGLCGIAGIGLGMAILFGGGPPPAPPRPRLPPPPAPISGEMKYSATMYRAAVEQDAKVAGVAAPTPEGMAAVFPYFDELATPRVLRMGGVIKTPHLLLSLIVRHEMGAIEGQSFRADHLVLEITNHGGYPVAYRVTTRVPDAARCEAKGVIPHNAIALNPRETVRRTECILQKTASLEVARIEVIVIPDLSRIYVSRLSPELILYDGRASAGHVIPRGNACPQTFSWREVRDGAERGQIAWRDIIDFYARHNCDEYAFFPGYRYRTDVTAQLPARPPS